jgi:hypothetical protein
MLACKAGALLITGHSLKTAPSEVNSETYSVIILWYEVIFVLY